MRSRSLKRSGCGVSTVTATVRNTRSIPSVAQQAAAHNIGLPDSLSLEGPGLAVLAGLVAHCRQVVDQVVETQLVLELDLDRERPVKRSGAKPRQRRLRHAGSTEKLQRHSLIEDQIVSAVDLTHAAPADQS